MWVLQMESMLWFKKTPTVDHPTITKQNFSLFLMATLDANYKFTTIYVGSRERFSDENILFASSPLGYQMC